MNTNSLDAYYISENSIMNHSERILHCLTLNGPMTCEQLAAATGIRHQSLSGMLTKLYRKKMIIDQGRRRTSSGCLASVWDHREPLLRKPTKEES